MADSTLNRFVASGTAAERAAFTPTPPTPASGPDQGYFWYETDTGNTYAWDGATWDQVNTGGVPDPIVPADGTQNITGALTVSGVITGSNLSGTNTGDQTSIVGITGTIAQFNTACTDADFATGGGTATGTNTGDQTSIVGISGTKAQFDSACSDGNFLYVGDITQYTDEMAQDAVGAMVDASLTYVDATPLLQRAALTGDVTAAAGSNATTIANNAVTNAKFRQSAGLSVVGRSANTTGDVADITGAANGVLRVSGTTLAFGAVDLSTAMVTGDLAFSNIAQIATDRLLGRDTAATGDIEALTVSGGIEFTGTGGIQTSAFTGDVTKTAGGTATTIANNAVSFAKFVAAPSVGIVWATGAGNYSHNASGGGTTNFLRADGTWAAPGGSGTVTTTGTPASGNLTAFSGATSITNSNLSGDVTTSGTLATTIANDAVTFAKMQNSSVASVLVGRGSASGAGDFQEITLGTNLSMSGTTLNATGGGGVSDGDKGDITVTASGATWTIDPAAVTLAKIQDFSANRVPGRAAGTSGVLSEIAIGPSEFLGRSASSNLQGIALGSDFDSSTTTLSIASDAITYAKLQNASVGNVVLARAAGTSGDYSEVVIGSNNILGRGAANVTALGLGIGVYIDGASISASGDSLTRPWQFSTTTTAADPGSGVFRLNNATLASVTALYVSENDRRGANADALIAALTSGHRLYIVENGTPGSSALFQLSGAPTDNTGWWTIPVTVVNSSTLPNNASIVNLCFIPLAAGTGGSTPTGTGFTHITAGVQDAAAKLVDTADINDAQVTYAKIQNVAAMSVVGNTTNGSAVATSIAAANDGNVLRRSGTSIGFGAIDLSAAGSAVSGDLAFSNIQQIATNSLVGRDTIGTGDIEVISVGGGIEFTGSGGIQTSAFTGNVTKTAGGTALTIANGVVSGAMLTTNGQVRCITFIIDGGGSAITTGVKGDLEIPFACTITGWTMLADQSGSIVVDIWKDTYANYPPTVADTITASDKPTISAATKGQDLAPTGWTTSVAAGDTLRFNVDSVSTVTRVTLSIRVNIT